MKKDTNIIVRVNSDIKNQATAIVEQNGLSLSSVINALLYKIVNTQRIDLSIYSLAKRDEPSTFLFENQLLIETLKLFANQYSEQYKIDKLFLFGSYARNEQTTNSDVDIHAVLTKDASLLDHSSLQIALEKLLRKKVDVITGDDNDSFIKRIKDHEILIYERPTSERQATN